MTARQVFEATLIELSKIQAPSLKLYEFNYLFNKAINQYINKVYNVYDINQQTTDDLRVLKSTCFLTPNKVQLGADNSAIKNIGKQSTGFNSKTEEYFVDAEGNDCKMVTEITDTTKTITYYKKTGGTEQEPVYEKQGDSSVINLVGSHSGQATSYLSQSHSSIQSLHGATYEVFLPIDYLHMLNCVCIYYVAKTKDCWDAGSYIEVPANRLTADSWSQIVTDIYNRPSPMRPYYYIHNMNQSQFIPTDPRRQYNTNTGLQEIGIDMNGTYRVTTNELENGAAKAGENSNFQRFFQLGDTPSTTVSLVEKPIALRAGNTSNVRCEIRYGKDDTLFQLAEVQIDYVKVPQHIRLTQEQIDLTEDTSQIMEFPDYVNQEIINELVHLVMERTSDPRTGTHAQIAQSIARPTGQQQQPQQAQQG